MFIQTIANWLKKEKRQYAYIHNKRVQRLYTLYKLHAPDIIIQTEIKLVKQTFIQYLLNKYIRTAIRNLLFIIILCIFPHFMHSYILLLDYMLHNYTE